MSTTGRRGRPAAARPSARSGADRAAAEGPAAGLPLAVWIACGAWATLLLLAPPASNWFWGVDAFRSLGIGWRIALLAVAALTGAIATRRLPGAAALAVIAGLPAVLAFALYERAHFLGDTAVRIGALAVFVRGLGTSSLGAWAGQLHAAPLDLLTGFLLPAGLVRLGLSPEAAIRWVSFALGVTFLLGVRRLIAVVAPPRLRAGLAIALVLNGTLLAFAGYAESAGLQLTSAVWWWAAALAPIRTRRSGFALAASWLVLSLSHRVVLVWLPVLVLRLTLPGLPEDDPAARRAARGYSLVAAAIGLLPFFFRSESVGYDFAEIFASLSRPGELVRASADLLDLLAVIAPLFLLTPFLAAGAGGSRGPRAGRPVLLLGAAALPLLPLAFVLSRVESWMGAQREWDVSVLLGLCLTLIAVLRLAALPEPRLRRTLVLVLPLLAITAFGWVFLQSDAPAALARARAIATGTPALPDGQRSNVHLYLARWAAAHDQPLEAARQFEASYDLAPTPNRGLLAARAWGLAGRLDDLRRMVARVRARGGLDADAREAADTLDAQAARLGR